MTDLLKSGTTIGAGLPTNNVAEASYTIFKNGGQIFAIPAPDSGLAAVTPGTDIAVILNSCLANLVTAARAGLIFIREGTYSGFTTASNLNVVLNSVLAPKTVTIKGSGKEATIIQCGTGGGDNYRSTQAGYGGPGGSNMEAGMFFWDGSDYFFEDLTIDANGQTPHCLTITNTTNATTNTDLRCRRVKFTNATNGAVRIVPNDTAGNTTAAITFVYGNECDVVNSNTSDSAGSAGITIERLNNTIVATPPKQIFWIASKFDNNKQKNFWIRGAQDVWLVTSETTNCPDGSGIGCNSSDETIGAGPGQVRGVHFISVRSNGNNSQGINVSDVESTTGNITGDIIGGDYTNNVGGTQAGVGGEQIALYGAIGLTRVQTQGPFNQVNNRTAAGFAGVPVVVAESRGVTLVGADTNRINYTPAASANRYRISGVVDVTAWTTPASFTVQAVYKDDAGTTRTETAQVVRGSTGAAAAAITAVDRWYYEFPYISINNAATPITVSTTGTFTGSPSYSHAATLELVG